MPKRNISDVRPGDVMLVEEAVPNGPHEYSDPPRTLTVEKTVALIEPMRSAETAAALGQVYRIEFADGSSRQWDQPRCWLVRQVFDA